MISFVFFFPLSLGAKYEFQYIEFVLVYLTGLLNKNTTTRQDEDLLSEQLTSITHGFTLIFHTSRIYVTLWPAVNYLINQVNIVNLF